MNWICRVVLMSCVLLAFAGVLVAADPLDAVLQSQVRVRAPEAGGSGTVIYSEKADDEFFSTYVITCWHVIEKAIKLEEKWDSLLGRDRKQEMKQPVSVEFFRWDAVPHGRPPLTSGTLADIVAYNQSHDMALLHLRLAKRPMVAKMLPPDRITSVTVLSPVVAVGCALGHDPIMTTGTVTHLGDIIDNKDYWMSNAQIIFGNSGGGMYLKAADGYFFIGIPSRVAVAGFGSAAVTHMGYFSPISRIYTFLSEQIFDFLIPGSKKTAKQCADERAAKKELEDQKLRYK